MRINAATFGIRGTEEKLGWIYRSYFLASLHSTFKTLVYESKDLVISIGGYLGLFIGVSMIDVVGYIVEFMDAILNKTVET